MVDAFLGSAWWEVVQWFSAVLGLTSLLSLLLDRGRSGWHRVRIWGGLALLFISIVFSMVFEDLLPTLKTLPPDHHIPFVLSFPGFLLATGLVIYGGWRFVRDTFRITAGFGRHGDSGMARERAGQSQQRLPAQSLFRSWLPGLCFLGGGFALFFLSASAHHESHFPLPGLWALFGS